MLDATAEANNRTALQESLDYYKTQMARVVGEDSDFIKEVKLEVLCTFLSDCCRIITACFLSRKSALLL